MLALLKNIKKSFSSVEVLHGVDFDLRKGEIHALLGENGAGKSTLMKILSGLESPDEGEIMLDGKKIVHHSPHNAILSGISIIHQELNIAQNLTVSENIFLGFEPNILGIFKDTNTMNTRAQHYLEKLGADFKATDSARTLTMGQQQQIEITKALIHQGKIIIFDEPTSSLSERESENLFSILRSLKDEGVSIAYITHRMNEVYALADRATVLCDGGYVGTLEKHEINDTTVIQMMVGRSLEKFYVKQEEHIKGDGNFEVLSIADNNKKVKRVSFTAHRGEVLGFAGLIGAGRTELARLICGIDRTSEGAVYLDGKEMHIRTPLDAIKKGIVYLPEDRKQQGLFLEMACSLNIILNKISAYAHMGILNQKKNEALVQHNVEQYNIKLAGPEIKARTLSGGNQQKLLIARLVSINPKVIIFDEPTRGVDIATKIEIYNLMHKMAQEGTVVIFISSDLPEVIGLAHRVLVMREGEITGEVVNSDITQDKIMRFATGIEYNYNTVYAHGN